VDIEPVEIDAVDIVSVVIEPVVGLVTVEPVDTTLVVICFLL
jgi:hypothetical protein